MQINLKLDDIKYDFSKVSGCEIPYIERISWKDEVDLTDIINKFKSMVKECVQWKNNSINKTYVSMNNSITILNLFFDNFLLEFNSRLWKSELHLVLNAFNNQISKKRLFPLFLNSDGSCKKLNQFLGFFSSSYLGALIMVSIFYRTIIRQCTQSVCSVHSCQAEHIHNTYTYYYYFYEVLTKYLRSTIY